MCFTFSWKENFIGWQLYVYDKRVFQDEEKKRMSEEMNLRMIIDKRRSLGNIR